LFSANAFGSKNILSKSRGKNQTLLNGSSTASFSNKSGSQHNGVLDESCKTDKSSSDCNQKSEHSVGSDFVVVYGNDSNKVEVNVETQLKNYKTAI
jgi:hypothetical protein